MDEIIISPALHQVVGGVVLLGALVAMFLTWRGFRAGQYARAQHLGVSLFQLALMLQALIGVKLLDQGMGVMQKYVHYLGGFGAIGLLMLIYWLPQRHGQVQPARAAILTAAALVFSVLSFTIGGLYARGGLS